MKWEEIRERVGRRKQRGTSAEREYTTLTKKIKDEQGSNKREWERWSERVRRGEVMQTRAEEKGPQGVQHKDREDGRVDIQDCTRQTESTSVSRRHEWNISFFGALEEL